MSCDGSKQGLDAVRLFTEADEVKHFVFIVQRIIDAVATGVNIFKHITIPVVDHQA